MSGMIVSARALTHSYGTGALRQEVLSCVDMRIPPGEVVVVTGPSGSGKTTLLTLIGGLRTVEKGSLCVFGNELFAAPERTLTALRKRIGYVFQAQNLIESLTAVENVELGMVLAANGHTAPAAALRTRALAMLDAVGLSDRAHHFPRQLSGGEKQRVAVARALVPQPQLILADEPTAALDRDSGRTVADVLRRLARQSGAAIVLATHDNRIFDIADRIVTLRDGRIVSLASAVLSTTRHLFGSLIEENRRGELPARIRDLAPQAFSDLLARVTQEFSQLTEMVELATLDAFDSMLEQILEAFTLKTGELLQAERVTLFLIDVGGQELWSKVAQTDKRAKLEIRIPMTTGIAGAVARSGVRRNVADAYQDKWFNRVVDQRTGFRTRSVLCMPLTDRAGRTFAVVELINRIGAASFSKEDEQRLEAFGGKLAAILEAWWLINQRLHVRTPSAKASASVIGSEPA